MILSGLEIDRKINDDSIEISGYDKARLNPNSYNLTLHEELLIYDKFVLDMKDDNKTSKIVMSKNGLLIESNKIYLGRTNEMTFAKDTVPMLEGRSSIGRLGVFIHITAGFGDVGFKGFWTLEISCIQPIVIYPNVEIAQIYFHTIDGNYEPYKGKYNENTGIQSSQLFKEFW